MLDPQLAAVIAPGAGPRLEDVTPPEARLIYREQCQALAAAVRDVAHVDVQDFTVPGAEGPLAARVYRTPEEGSRPTIAFFHGGGYVVGDLDSHDAIARVLARNLGAVIVSVAYRLAPEHPFPAAAEDAIAAATWIAEHAAGLGGEPAFAVAGDSAGAALAAVAALALRDDAAAVAGQLLFYPAADPATEYASVRENAEGYLLERATIAWFLSHYAPEAQPDDPRLAPLRADALAGVAPAVVVVAEHDPLRDSGEAFALALDAAEVPLTLRRCDGMVHGFLSFAGVSDAAAAHTHGALASFREILDAAREGAER
ncbi:MAG: alpha/beta hydrolase [Actinobacteria bacterium]|nr:alpha/beta hydrolase [Actinomycetota bacterium]